MQLPLHWEMKKRAQFCCEREQNEVILEGKFNVKETVLKMEY
jgi:hypothetical protein